MGAFGAYTPTHCKYNDNVLTDGRLLLLVVVVRVHAAHRTEVRAMEGGDEGEAAGEARHA